jgi:CheY-like chemotaxis protein
MGGDIAVSPRPGGGSVFSLALELPAMAEAPPAPDLRGRRALIVAPDGLAPPVIAEQLARAGAFASVTAEVSHAAALTGAAAAAAEPYDLILFDQRSAAEPADAVRTIREAAGRNIPTALLMAPGRRHESGELRASGFDAYLIRPVRRASLFRIVLQMTTEGAGFGVDPVDRKAPEKQRAGAVGLKVLLAEDDEINALLLRTLLHRFGHDVTEVADGDAALAAIRDSRFDAMLLDLHLPGADGYAIARAARSAEAEGTRPRTAIIAVTADARPESRDAALAAGFDRYLQKPVTPDALRDALRPLEASSAAA